jgi:hypothetical protein
MAGKALCTDERFTVCKSDGSGPDSGGTVCASNQVCDSTLGCGATAVDSLGREDSENGLVELNGFFYRVDTPRVLTSVEISMVAFSQNATASVYIYDADNEDGPYTRRIIAPAAGVSISHPRGTATLTYQLQAGKFYFIGTYGSEVAAQFSTAPLTYPSRTSFGVVFASGRADLVALPPDTLMLSDLMGTTAYYQVLTTRRP